MVYKVKLPVFEGPLDLLLYLIKKEEINVYDIPIARITDQYLEYLEIMKLLDLDIAGEFLVMAATLMHIKSKMLLPPSEDEITEEEEQDPREELVRKLLEYKKFKEAAAQLKELALRQKDTFSRKPNMVKELSEEIGFEASLFDLITAFTKVLKEVPKHEFQNVVRDEFTVSEKIHEMLHMLVERQVLYFTELFKKAKNKAEIIVMFLALLELVRLKEIIVRQKSPFSEIEIIRNPEWQIR